jgi:outer membrane cobalamin receptor
LSWVTIGYEHVVKKHIIGLNISVENLFDKAYQSIAWRPMPGRSFMINLQYQFK